MEDGEEFRSTSNVIFSGLLQLESEECEAHTFTTHKRKMGGKKK